MLDLPNWTGRTVVVIGSGPSLTTSHVRHVARAVLSDVCHVVAVNDAVYLAWWADWLHGCDFKWWNWNIQSVQHFAGIRTTTSDGVPRTWGAQHLRVTGELGYDPEPGCVRHGSNGAYQAVHSAMQCHASRVILLGVDCNVAGGAHYFGHHPDTMVPDWGDIARKFHALVEPARDLGCDIVNCSPLSAVTAFRMADITTELYVP